MIIRDNLGKGAEAQMHPAAIGPGAFAHKGCRGGTILCLRCPAILVHALHHEAQMTAVWGIINRADRTTKRPSALFPSL